MRALGLAAGENLVTRHTIPWNGQPSHERAVWPDRNRDAIDLKSSVPRSDSSKDEVRIPNREELIGLGIRDAYLQRTTNIWNRRELRIRGRQRSRNKRRNDHWFRSGRTCCR